MTRLYRALLRLYPSSFRHEYGDELTQLFAQRVAEEGRLTAWLAALADVLPNAAASQRSVRSFTTSIRNKPSRTSSR